MPPRDLRAYLFDIAEACDLVVQFTNGRSAEHFATDPMLRSAVERPRWRGRLKEIARAREVVCDFLVGDNEYGSTAESLDAYFLPFAMAARGDR